MKILISTILLLLFPFSSAWALPECKQSADYWNNCYAKFTYDGGDKYEGEWKDNKRHGQGTYYYLDNNKFYGDKYEGQYKNGIKNGQGTYTFANGDKYVGEWKDNKAHGQGTYTFADGEKYVGEFNNDLIHGYGTYTFANGGKYVGEFNNDLIHGYGTYTYDNGAKYVGEFKDHKRHGQGTYTYTSGNKYVGEWKADKRHGQGTFTYIEGDKYEGEYENGLQHGQGTYTYANGEKYVGENKNGTANGQGTYTYPNGDKYIGEFKNDTRYGQGTFYFNDGRVWDGQWENNEWVSGKKYAKGQYKNSTVASNKCLGSPLKKTHTLIPSSWHNCEGTFVFTDEQIKNSKYIGEFKDGQMHEGTFYFLADNEFYGDKYAGEFKNNLFHGQGTYTYAEGDKYVGEFKDHNKYGQGTYTYAEGDKYVGEWKDDKKHGQGTYTHAEGDKYVGEYKNGKKHGQGTYTFASGNKYVGEFQDDKRHGQGTYTYIEGDKYEGEYKNGKQHGQGTYTFADGEKYVGENKDNRMHGQGTFYFNDGRVWDGQWENNEWVSGKKYAKGEYKDSVIADNNKNNVNKNDDKSEELIPAASGSGFIVSKLGHIVSNNHVIKGCETVKAHHKGKSFEAMILATDTINDLALLQVDFSPSTVFSISQNNTELMQDVFVAGYPFGVSVSNSVKITRGIVSSLAGVGNNYSNMQIDAALQPGNSGGPILDEKGNVVGVAVAKLDLELAIEEFGVVPEGTNFGIKSSVLKNFLQSNSIDLQTPKKRKISKSVLSKKITDGTLFLSCWMTHAQIEKLKTKKIMFKNLQ